VVIAAAGVLSEEDIAKEEEERKAHNESAAGQDVWEDYPADEDKIDAEKAEEALSVAQKLKVVGTE
jgi:peptidyl-prolyl isomerase D